jgi:hypothetical protein
MVEPRVSHVVFAGAYLKELGMIRADTMLDNAERL